MLQIDTNICSHVHKFELTVGEKQDENIQLTADNIDLLRNALNICFQKVVTAYDKNSDHYLIQINIGSPLLYRKFLKSGA